MGPTCKVLLTVIGGIVGRADAEETLEPAVQQLLYEVGAQETLLIWREGSSAHPLRPHFPPGSRDDQLRQPLFPFSSSDLLRAIAVMVVCYVHRGSWS